MDNQTISNIFVYIIQVATTSLIVWGIKLQWNMWTAIVKLQVVQDHIVQRVEKLENK